MGIAYRDQRQEVQQMYFYSISKESCKVSVRVYISALGRAGA